MELWYRTLATEEIEVIQTLRLILDRIMLHDTWSCTLNFCHRANNEDFTDWFDDMHPGILWGRVETRCCYEAARQQELRYLYNVYI